MNIFTYKTLYIVVFVAIAIGIAIFNPGLYPIFSTVPPGGSINVNTEDQMKNADMLSASSGSYEVRAEDVEYFAGAQGLYVEPTIPGTYPGVVMIHENRGLRPEIRQTAEQLAKEGYRVLAVDLFDGRVVETQDEARAITASFDHAKAVENMQSAVQYLKDKGASKVASLGWCFGGRQSVALAISGAKLDATVVYYGGGMATTTEQLKPITWPVLGVFGDQDQAIPLSMVEAFKTSLNTLNVPNEIHIYPGVGHAFANPSGMNYAPEATQDAWSKTLAFLKKNLKQ
jgi:carboxymethylenebutenolidase